MKGKIKGIIFDYGGVLSKPQNENCIANMVKLLSIDDEAVFREIYRSFRNEYDSGSINGVAYWTKITDYFGLKYNEELINKLIEQDVYSWVTVNQDMIDYVELLSNKEIQLAILSNMTLETLYYMKREFNWLNIFDQCVFSCNNNMNKPNSDIYQYCVRQMDLKPDECVFIDDTYENIVGAEQCEINTILYENIEQLKQTLNEYLVSTAL
jgi:epoxide hydrolase-like predicted phosphatase